MLKTCVCVLSNANVSNIVDGDIIGVDKGALICHRNNIDMKYIIGDFDSVNDVERQELFDKYETVELNPIKDVSDAEASVIFALEKGYERIILICEMEGRFDHTLVVFKLVENYGCEIIDSHNHIYLLPKGKNIIKKGVYPYVSFFTNVVTTISISNVKYPLVNKVLYPKDTLCLSNEIIDAECIVESDTKIICIQSKD